MKKKFTLIVMVFLTAGTLFAQTDRMSYQAVLRNADNELVYNENLSVQVQILDASGAVQYSELHSATTNANGMISLVIGNGTNVTGNLSEVIWQNAVIRSVFTLADGTVITQATPVTAVPYAKYAERAGNVFSGDYNDLVNRPEIPTVPENVSVFNNDARYVSNAFCDTVDICSLMAIINQLQVRISELEDRINSEDTTTTDPVQPTPTTIDGQPCPNAPTVTDVDGNVYSTIQIGDQCWMRENLRTIPTNAIYGVNGNTIRDAVDIGYYYYPDNSNELVSQYGLLYNWTATTGGANDFQGTVQGVCPNGWHLPGYADYSQFRQYMDTATCNNVPNGYRCNISFSIAKSLAHVSNWIESDVACTPGNNSSTNNTSGFDAPASGFVWYANYVDYNKSATFWTATEHNNDVTAGYYFGITHDREDAFLSFDNKGNGRSVRCLRD